MMIDLSLKYYYYLHWVWIISSPCCFVPLNSLNNTDDWWRWRKKNARHSTLLVPDDGRRTNVYEWMWWRDSFITIHFYLWVRSTSLVCKIPMYFSESLLYVIYTTSFSPLNSIFTFQSFFLYYPFLLLCSLFWLLSKSQGTFNELK